jgi:predicted dienelactone hydrolase
MKTLLRALLLSTTLLSAGGHAADPSRYQDAGTARVENHDLRWTDAGRARELPLRVRLPDTEGPRPLIVFSHGLGGSVDGGRFWGEHWASHGFAVIHLQHPGSDESVWQGQPRPALSMRRAATGEQLIERVRDVRFVLDELARRQQAGDPQAARIDLDRIGVAGHSFGAVTTQALAGQAFEAPRRGQAAAVLADPRPRAFIALSPSARSEDQAGRFAAIERPFFSITGSADGTVGPGLGVAPHLRLLPFEGMPPGDKFLLNLTGADHMIFNGTPRRRSGNADPVRDPLHIALVKTTSTAFWLAYLSDDKSALHWLRSASGHIGSAGEFHFK